MKKILLIIISVLIVAIASSIYLLIPKNTKPAARTDIPTYHVDKGLEDIAQKLKPGIEAYLNQSSSETQSVRVSRLKKYFTTDSRIFEYEPPFITQSIKKSIGYITSIKNSETDGIDSINVTVQMKLTSIDAKMRTVYKLMWVAYQELPDKTILINDIGEY